MNTRWIFIFALCIAAPWPATAVDVDGDTVDDAIDNCFEVANPTQCDTDLDNIGNHCDADLDNNCIVNSFDLAIMRANFGQTGDNAADLDCNGVVNSFDLSLMRQAFGKAPGPSSFESSCSFCDNPPSTEPMRWVEHPRAGMVVAGSSQVVRACPQGARMTVTTQELLRDYTYTLWFGFFENPDACLFPPRTMHNPTPTLKCGMFDLFNPAVDANMRFGDGLVATGTDDVFDAYLAAGAPPGMEVRCGESDPEAESDWGKNTGTLCSGEKIGWGYNDDDPIVLTEPLKAEYQAVLKVHGPEDPTYMPAQIETALGGCHPADDNGTPLDDSDDTPAEPYFPCRDPQVAGALSDLGAECLDDPVCFASLVASVGAPFVSGWATGTAPATAVPPDTVGDTFSLMIGARGEYNAIDEPDLGEGSFRFTHKKGGVVQADWSGVIDCISVSPSNQAHVLARYTSGTPAPVDPAIVFSIEDSGANDSWSFNAAPPNGVPITGTCTPVLDRGVIEVIMDDGEFYVSD